jgi:hypothetical protein
MTASLPLTIPKKLLRPLSKGAFVLYSKELNLNGVEKEHQIYKFFSYSISIGNQAYALFLGLMGTFC